MLRTLSVPSFMRLRSRRRRSGFTYLEVLVALAVAMTFLSSLYVSFIYMLRTMDENTARLDAMRNGRSAIMTMSDEFKAISAIGVAFVPQLIAADANAGFGNGFDEDDDGTPDEEILDGQDDDGDWSPLTDDLHAQIVSSGIFYDRFHYTAFPPFAGLYGVTQFDLGDFHVDQDCVFGRDQVVFRIVPSPPIPDVLFRSVTYTVGSIDGQNNVLLRQARTEFDPISGRSPIITTSPIAFNVLGLDLLYWDPNGDPDPNLSRATRPYWITTWDSTLAPTFNAPKLPLPASIYARVTLYAEDTTPQTYVPGSRVNTMHFETIINIEEIIGDISYPRASI